MHDNIKKLPIELNYSLFFPYISNAQYSIGKLESLFRILPNPALLTGPLLVKEAALSSQIEGTRSSINDVYSYDAGEKTKYEDVKEVSNYRKALKYAQIVLQDKSISLALIKETHEILLEGIRGHHHGRGRFRMVQNWIGRPGTPIEEAVFIPPPPQKVMEYMENLEKYINGKDRDVLVQAALMHLQFEAIHPFLDGNGRIGRILIPLFLYEKEVISCPAFYISEYFEQNKREYYEKLNLAQKGLQIEDWVILFLKGIYWQSEKIQQTINEMAKLYNGIKQQLFLHKSIYSFKLLDFMFYHPVFTMGQVVKELKLNKVTVSRLVNLFVNLKILHESEKKRNTIYTFFNLLKLLQK